MGRALRRGMFGRVHPAFGRPAALQVRGPGDRTDPINFIYSIHHIMTFVNNYKRVVLSTASVL